MEVSTIEPVAANTASEPAISVGTVNSDGTTTAVPAEAAPDCRSDSESAVDATTAEPVTHAVSKKQLKRQRKAEIWQQNKVLKKAKEKERKRMMKEAQRAERAQLGVASSSVDASVEGEAEVSSAALGNAMHTIKKSRSVKAQEKADYIQRCSAGFAVIIDCDWENCQSERQIRSLAQQLSFTYGFNRRHSHPAQLYITGLRQDGLLQSALKKANFEYWVDIVSTPEDYTTLPAFVVDPSSPPQPDSEDAPVLSNETDQQSKASPKRIVYLTSDASEMLTTLDTNCAYVIGGMVDRNRHKGATFNKAIAQGVATAKLPIREHLAMAGTHILTVNHVHQILLQFASTGSWEQAVAATIPQRKVASQKEQEQERTGPVEEEDEVGDRSESDTNKDSNSGSDSDSEGSEGKEKSLEFKAASVS